MTTKAGVRRRGLARALGAALIAMGCSGGVVLPEQRQPVPGSPAPAPAVGALESRLHDLVNRHRTSRGLARLTWEPRVAELAREHSLAMARGSRGFGHDGFDDRADAISGLLPAGSVAENVAYDGRTGPDLASLVAEGWIASPGHRKNIEGDFTTTGIGAARGAGDVYYFTQIFVKAR